MYCSHCGKEIADSAAFCPNCGTSTNENKPLQKSNEPNYLLIIGFILAIFLPPVGVILSNIAYYKARKCGDGKSMSFAYAGCIVGAIMLLICFILLLLLL